MKASKTFSVSSRFVLGAVLVIAPVTIVQSFTSGPAEAAPAATYTHGRLRLAIPYRAPRAGAGRLLVDVLNPEDEVLGHLERSTRVAGGNETWREEVTLAKALPADELVWHRLRYRFSYDGKKTAAIEGTESISEILRTPVIHILGQQSYLTGGQAAVRVIVTDSKNDPVAGPSSLRIDLAPTGKTPRVLFTGRLNQRGTAEAQFRFPPGVRGSYPLLYAVDTPIGSAEFTQQVRLEDKSTILLTTEKPLYQPGQTIHARALVLDRGNHQASAGRKLTFELEDSRGNKVFKKSTQTDEFGIASAEFGLADEVNLGAYHLRALMDDPQTPGGNAAEIALSVERYVLPKFKVAMDFAGKDNAAKHGYRPGDHVTGTVRANYFFGKPVEGAHVTVKATGMDVAQFEARSAEGKTDQDGAYRFDLRLPAYFAGRPLSQGAARVLVDATVKDTAGHSETRGEPIMVSESPLLLTAVPEGGTLAAGLDNQVFVVVSYADGRPATADLTVHATGNPDQNVVTDAGGVAVVRVKAGVGSQNLRIDAADNEGNRISTSVSLETRQGMEQILLRTEGAVYHEGDRIPLRIFSTKNHGTIYVDVVKEGQTVLTRDLDIVNGEAKLALTATPEMAGTLDFSAYLFGRDARPVADHRLVFVQPADELKIEAAADSPTYKPGNEARIRFRVTNARGEGVHAALGLQVVDEAVFALAEKQPGFAKLFFYLEQEAMKPRYEIHSIGMPEIVEPVEKAQAAQRDRAARALFSATELVNANKFEIEFGRTVPQTRYAEYAGRYRERFSAQIGRLSDALTRAYAGNPKAGDLTQVAAQLAETGAPECLDAWGTTVRVEHVPWYPQGTTYLVRSAGTDKRFDTADDLAGYLELRTRKIVGRPTSGASAIDISLEHSRGPFNSLAEIDGTLMDSRGGALERTSIRIREIASGRIYRPRANDDGRFQLPALAPGVYEIEVPSGSGTISKKLALAARDRAMVSAVLGNEPAGAIVAVNPRREAVLLQRGQAGAMQIRFGGNLRRFEAFEARPANGVIGGLVDGVAIAAPLPPPPATPPPPAAAKVPTSLTIDKVSTAVPRVRSYFPEALYINPEIITDRNGVASIVVPLADSITTWRMAMMASTARGALGGGVSSLKVFQDFFVDLDLPVKLTQGDHVSIPVAAYNYSGAAGNVALELQPDNWYRLVEDVPNKTITMEPGRVGASQFTLEATRIGKFKLTLAARMNGAANRADIVVREIEVVPNGREQNQVFNGRLETTARQEVIFPAAGIPDAEKIFVRLYPGPLSQVIEGMDAILRMPFGCFEQTSSSTYPNVLALDYMKRTKKLTPEVHAKAEGFIANGYQRLLTFEVPGGGFSWFGSTPANKILTAYGLMEFYDMAQVYDVDPRLIQRTQQWLASQQQADGSWKPDATFINEGATNRYNSDVLRITSYIGWALENTGYQGPAVEKARQFVGGRKNANGARPDAYTLAALANFAADYHKDREFMRDAMQQLLDARNENEEHAWWTAEETGVYASGPSAAVETTGLAVQALLKLGEASGTVRKALNYIASKKDSNGTWGNTQATIMALRALLLSTAKGAADVRGTVEISLNGRTVESLRLTPDNNDLLHQFVFGGVDANGANNVELRFSGKGGLAYQVVARSFIPWDRKPMSEPLSIDMTYDRTQLAQDDIATATATIKNNLTKRANMVMVDLGIPPGFDLLSEDLQTFQERSAGQRSGRLEKFSLTATQAILYFDSIGAGDTVTVRYRLHAKYPIRTHTFQSRVYEYYDPEVASVAVPVQLEVRKR